METEWKDVPCPTLGCDRFVSLPFSAHGGDCFDVDAPQQCTRCRNAIAYAANFIRERDLDRQRNAEDAALMRRSLAIRIP